MSLLSKTEVQFLQGQKQVSKSYEYKLKSTLKKKLSNLLDKDIPLLSLLFPNLLDLTKFSKKQDLDFASVNLTKNSKMLMDHNNQNNLPKSHILENAYTDPVKIHPTRTICGEAGERITEYYINNPSRLIKTAVGSGGVEATVSDKHSSHTVRLSISPSQGDDPGFKSRPEHS